MNKCNGNSFYKCPQHNNSEQLFAHMDAGSMASTTDWLDFLSDFQSLHDTTPTLHTPCYPTGAGYLKVPTIDPPGYTSVWTFYTPSLLATILLISNVLASLALQISMVKIAVLHSMDAKTQKLLFHSNYSMVFCLFKHYSNPSLYHLSSCAPFSHSTPC